APAPARRFVRQWLEWRAGTRRVVVLTLREAGYYPQINSRIEAWAGFARSLDERAYLPVIVRDTEAAFAPTPAALQGLTLFPEAALNLEIRAALYEEAFVGLSVGTGPMTLQWLNHRCRFIIFKLLAAGNFRARPTPLRAMGFDVGGPLSTGMPLQRLVWEDDEPEIIDREFKRMVAEIEADPEANARPPIAAEAPLRIARRLRLTARGAPAERVYAHLQAGHADPIVRSGAEAGRALIMQARRRALGFWGKLLDMAVPGNVRIPVLERRSATSIDADALLEIADWLLSFGRADEARSLCDAILERDPKHAEALCLAGEIDLRRGRLAQALDLLGQSARLLPTAPACRYRHGVALLAQGQDRAAAAEFYAAALDDPSHEAVRLRLRELASDLVLPKGFTYEDALARRPMGVVGTVGELDFPIELPTRRSGHLVIYFRGLFHAVADTGQPTIVAWDDSRPYRVADRFGMGSHALSRLQRARFPLAPLLARLASPLLLRRIPAVGVVTAATLAELDRRIVAGRDRSASPGIELSPGVR
ncbi:MAG TPA: tetratricopeptide repeat protein, partial [Stellaceae bacterium]|nr:tetratricopeptide repeat protein [Stellaceae bacterium]